MELDINTLRGLATVLCMLAFVAITLWAYSDRKRKDFDEAANLPFADEPPTADPKSGSNNKKETAHV